MPIPSLPSTETALLVLLISIVVFVVTLILMPYLIKKLKHRGIVGIDFHKIARPKIPEMGGIGIFTALAIGSALALIMFPENSMGILSVTLTMATAAMVGLVDDLKRLGPKIKPILTAAACWPIILLQTYDPHPVLPFIGETRLTIVYPIMIPVAIAIAANAVNMLDILNGAMPSTCIPVAVAMLIASIILGSTEAMILSAILASVLLAYYKFNRFPAKIFDGDVGSLAVGATIAGTAIVGRLEIIVVVAMIPFIMNSFHSLASIGRLFERREVRLRPTFLKKDERIAANSDLRSPLTLARIVVGKVPLREYEVVRVLFILSAFSSFLAVVTTIFLMT